MGQFANVNFCHERVCDFWRWMNEKPQHTWNAITSVLDCLCPLTLFYLHRLDVHQCRVNASILENSSACKFARYLWIRNHYLYTSIYTYVCLYLYTYMLSRPAQAFILSCFFFKSLTIYTFLRILSDWENSTGCAESTLSGVLEWFFLIYYSRFCVILWGCGRNKR